MLGIGYYVVQDSSFVTAPSTAALLHLPGHALKSAILNSHERNALK
jgi:hypothetical protein